MYFPLKSLLQNHFDGTLDCLESGTSVISALCPKQLYLHHVTWVGGFDQQRFMDKCFLGSLPLSWHDS